MSADMSLVEGATLEAMSFAAMATRKWVAENGDRDACGFAWVAVEGVRSNSKLGKALLANGWRKDYLRRLVLWNPSKSGVQSISALEAGANIAAEIISKRLGVSAHSESRLD